VRFAGQRRPPREIFPSTEEALMAETRNPSGVSRRTVLLAAAGAAPILALTGGQAQAKIAQTAVHYQPTPKDGKQCDGCNFFMAPSGCKLVDGEIAATGWCALWAKKAPA
jgi:hypothetical protein